MKILYSKLPSTANKIYASNLTMKDIILHVNQPIIIVRTLSIKKLLPADELNWLIYNNTE